MSNSPIRSEIERRMTHALSAAAAVACGTSLAFLLRLRFVGPLEAAQLGGIVALVVGGLLFAVCGAAEVALLASHSSLAGALVRVLASGAVGLLFHRLLFSVENQDRVFTGFRAYLAHIFEAPMHSAMPFLLPVIFFALYRLSTVRILAVRPN
jgi:hypothetical protein